MLNKLSRKLIKDDLWLDESSLSPTGEADNSSIILPPVSNILTKEQAPPSKHRSTEIDKEERKVVDITAHLNFCQKVALIGSWEADISAEGHSNIYWSDEVFKMLGYEPGRVTATFRCFVNAIHEEDRQNVIKKLEDLVKNGGSFEIEHRLITTAGTEKTVLNTVEVFVDEHLEKPYKLLGTIQDITEKRKQDKDLTSLNYELKTLFENMQEAFWSIDMNTLTTLQITPACEKVFGYSAEDFMQNCGLLMEVILDEDKHIIADDYHILTAGLPLHHQYRILTKHGDIRWIECRTTPTLDNGKLVRLDGVTSDITERRQSEIAIKENELKFRTLMENSSDGITVADESFTLKFASTSMCRLTGHAMDEMIGKPAFSFFHPNDNYTCAGTSIGLKDNPGVPLPLHGRFLKKDGSYFFYEGYVTNFKEDPIIGGYVFNFHNVTERHNAEEALKSSNLELKKTNKELDRFVYSVSHDLRAPLASILGALEYAETETEDQIMLKYLNLMKGSAKKLDGFILDILNYSRNARMEIKKEAVDFAELLDDVRSNLKYMGSKKSTVDIRIQLDNSHAFYSDKSRLSIIINNLVSNAIRYYNPSIADPYVEITIKASKTCATLVVKDNGLGINKKFHDKIFDMFYRLSKKSQGSGLGLYIVKETVEKLQGTLQLQSEPGEGTEFTISIPNAN